jgi:hypothetical protein
MSTGQAVRGRPREGDRQRDGILMELVDTRAHAMRLASIYQQQTALNSQAEREIAAILTGTSRTNRSFVTANYPNDSLGDLEVA